MSSIASNKAQWTHVEIRPFEDRDYEPSVEIDNLNFPEHRGTIEEARYRDEHFDRSKYFDRKYVAEEPGAGRVVGYVQLGHMPWNFHDDKYSLWVSVHPTWHHRGIGSTLYTRALEELRERGAVAVRSSCRESMTNSLAFLRARGFVERMRNWESHLSLADFDFTKFADRWGPPGGIQIVTLAEELARDPDCPRAVFDMTNAIMPDVPLIDPFTPPTYEMFLAEIRGPNAIPEAFYLAQDGDRYVGISALWRSQEMREHLFQGLTGVLREYRNRGIAMSLKLRTVAYARDRGFAKIRTWNNTENRGMLGINERLGFVKQPAWIILVKDLTGGGAA